jgi:hypothetical protein
MDSKSYSQKKFPMVREDGSNIILEMTLTFKASE